MSTALIPIPVPAMPAPAPVRMPLFGGIVPAEDADEFTHGVAQKARDEFAILIKYVPGILSSKVKMHACTEAGEALGLSGKTIYHRVVELYAKSGDWRDLLNRSTAGARCWRANDAYGVPQATIQLYKSLVEKYRSDTSGWRALIAQWNTHRDEEGRPVQSISGYTTWPTADPATGIPRGWTKKNLNKLAAHHPYDKAAARISPFAAAQFRPPVLTTRVGLRLLEFIQADDHEYNVKIHFPGQSKAMRPRGFNAIDVLTCHTFAKSFKPTLWDADLRKKEALTETDFMWFIVHVLTDIGYRTDAVGTTIQCERGTAAIRSDFEARIHAVTGGHIKISRGAMMDTPAHPGQFKGEGKGNFKHKALIEGSFNLIDNYFSSLPGQTGLDWNHFPSDTDGREKYTARLLKQAAEYPIEKVAGAQLSILTWAEFLNRATDIYNAIGWTTEHEISDWEQCGFVSIKIRWENSMPWASMKSLPPIVQQTLAAVDDESIQRKAFRFSRQEAWDYSMQADKACIAKVPPAMYPILMGPEAARELTVTKHSLFEFTDSDYSTQPFRFLADSRTHKFVPGQTYQCYVNPCNPRVLVACDASGRVKGICQWYDIPCKNDVEAIKRSLGAQNHFEAEHRNEIAARHLDEAKDRAHMIAHNDALIAAAKANEPDQEQQDLMSIANAAIDREANV